MLYRDVKKAGKWTIEDAIKFRVFEQWRVTKNFLIPSMNLHNNVRLVDISESTERDLEKSDIDEAIRVLHMIQDDPCGENDDIFKWQPEEKEAYIKFALDYTHDCLEHFRSLQLDKKAIELRGGSNWDKKKS